MLIKISNFENDDKKNDCTQLSIPKIHEVVFLNVGNMKKNLHKKISFQRNNMDNIFMKNLLHL